jgi:hypothetical protein
MESPKCKRPCCIIIQVDFESPFNLFKTMDFKKGVSASRNLSLTKRKPFL